MYVNGKVKVLSMIFIHLVSILYIPRIYIHINIRCTHEHGELLIFQRKKILICFRVRGQLSYVCRVKSQQPSSSIEQIHVNLRFYF